MVKCLGICFSLCCALGSPPQRTRGDSNMAATIKGEPNPHEIKINPHNTQPTTLTFYYYFLYLFYAFRTNILVRYRLCCIAHTTQTRAYIELFSEELPVVCRAYPVLLLQ